MQGLHLTADLYDCGCDPALLTAPERLAALCRDAVAAAGLTQVAERFHAFPDGGGVTGVALLAESHLALHTWPELGAVTLDAYVCNFRGDNSTKAERLVADLAARFRPARQQIGRMQRGGPPR